jgi:hypothetical protein
MMSSLIETGCPFEPAGPLWARAPTRDEQGRPVSDFMIVIPGLRGWPPRRRDACISCLQGVLAASSDVVFADLNLRLNLLWVSVRAQPGSCGHVAAAVCEQVPEARLVSPNPDHFRRG